MDRSSSKRKRIVTACSECHRRKQKVFVFIFSNCERELTLTSATVQGHATIVLPAMFKTDARMTIQQPSNRSGLPREKTHGC
ncbi:hypothetical protein LIPSTDRAFT_204501 [Lipomyces starkeyi NRRL Y-11557]|uniref:Uncharacterized protein n=1 Tax=Lipomyces starkeyi NRRL Y-11557 TaxID=675824 RepID=A0A1E3PVV4_LIPST|nr:hypothetical protein LIPSTDRAFT_204501 [Lipomyces starkeyi NRRL Y-11557]